jgi:hypothetical protein
MKGLGVSLPLVSVLAVAALSSSCSTDPIHDGAVAAQGKETTGVPIGEFHRAGQPCIVCHEDHGPANSVFSVAGTIFAGPNNFVGVDGAEVDLTDADGTKHTVTTNCVGNFFVKPSDWNPKFPILVGVSKGGASRQMSSVIGRDGSCAFCHVKVINDENQYGSMPHIYLFADADPAGVSTACPVNPDLGQP